MADKDKQPQQKDFDEAQEKVKKDPKSAPKFIDGMPPKEDIPDPKKGIEEGLKAGAMGKTLGKALGMGPLPAKKKGGKITAANYDKEYGKIYRKAVKKMSSGGTASSRADGCAVRGKTKA